MKLCPGFHNPFASNTTLQQLVFWCQEEVNSPTSEIVQSLESHVHCSVQSFTSCAEAFRVGAGILQRC